jgi:uncharacterized coiled-coil protein SlyX
MDINQAARMIEWLDEERRRDKSTIATLEERLAQQQDTIDMLTKRVNGVESDQTTMRSQFVPSGRDTDMMDQLRKEMQQMIEATESKRLLAEREAERRAELARETVSRPVRELAEKVTRIERQSTEIPAIHVERDRVAAAVAALQQRVDDLFKKFEEPDVSLKHSPNYPKSRHKSTALSQNWPCWKIWRCVPTGECRTCKTVNVSAVKASSSSSTNKHFCCNSVISRLKNLPKNLASRTAKCSGTSSGSRHGQKPTAR